MTLQRCYAVAGPASFLLPKSNNERRRTLILKHDSDIPVWQNTGNQAVQRLICKISDKRQTNKRWQHVYG